MRQQIKKFGCAVIWTATLIVLTGCGSGVINANGALLMSIVVTPANTSLSVGTSRQFTATGSYSDNTTMEVTDLVAWSSSDTEVASVANKGMVTAQAKGTAIITASLLYARCPGIVTVTGADVQAQWARTNASAIANQYSYFYGTSVAPDGSVYAAGVIQGTSTYDFGNNVSAAGAYSFNNIVLVKYDSAGTAQWARTVTAGDGDSWFAGVSVSPDGSVYAAGGREGSGTFEFGNNVTAAGAYAGTPGDNALLVKYDSSGTALWAKTVVTASDQSDFNDVYAASDGSIYVAGEIVGTNAYDFGSAVTVTGTSDNENAVLVKYDSSGAAQWAKTIAVSAGQCSLYDGVSAGTDGSVFAAGYIKDPGIADLGSGVTTTENANGYNMVLAKYDDTGAATWAKTAIVTGGDAYSWFNSVSVAPDGSVYAAASLSGPATYDFGNSVGVTSTNVENNMVLAKYSSAGEAVWAQTDSANNAGGNFARVVASSDGFVYAVGAIDGTGTYNFSNGVTATGSSDLSNILLVKYDSSGMARWAKTVDAGSNISWFSGIAVAQDGSLYAAGYIDGFCTFDFGDAITAATAGAGDFLLVKYK
jgi:hypothetical protein